MVTCLVGPAESDRATAVTRLWETSAELHPRAATLGQVALAVVVVLERAVAVTVMAVCRGERDRVRVAAVA